MSDRTPELHITETVPPRFERTYRRALGLGDSSPSRTAAIKCMCVQCQGWEDGVVEAVRTCADKTCPLWAVRPYQRGDDGEDEGSNESQSGSQELAEGEDAPLVEVDLDDMIRRDEAKRRKVEALVKARAVRDANRNAAKSGDKEELP